MVTNRENGNLDGGWYPQMGRARGLLQTLDRIRSECDSIALNVGVHPHLLSNI